MRKLVAYVLIAVCLSANAFALSLGREESIFTSPLTYILISAAILALGSLIVLQSAIGLGPTQKKIVFWILVGPAIASTLFLAAHTLYENVISETGGPVHWHADYQVWACGSRLDLIDPTGITNKIGEPLLHEHNDDRIHVEGTVLELSEISLGRYFEAIGGKLASDELVYPAVDKVYSFKNGDACGDGSAGTLKVYVNGERMENPENYVLSPFQLAPPGDCIIFRFDQSDSPTTELLCESWEARDWDYGNFHEKRGEV